MIKIIIIIITLIGTRNSVLVGAKEGWEKKPQIFLWMKSETAGTRLSYSLESANWKGRITELLMIILLHSALLLEVSNVANVLPNPNTGSREAPGERQPANLTSIR